MVSILDLSRCFSSIMGRAVNAESMALRCYPEIALTLVVLVISVVLFHSVNSFVVVVKLKMRRV